MSDGLLFAIPKVSTEKIQYFLHVSCSMHNNNNSQIYSDL